MNEFEKQWYAELLEELAVYADLGAPPVRRLTGALASIGEAVAKLKNEVTENPFASWEVEVEFFKHTKPAFFAEQFYALEIFNIESTRPLNDVASMNAFYEQELKYVKRFFDQHKFLYAYYQGDMKELDKLLFVRGAQPVDIPVPDVADLDPSFGTCGDRLFAKFRAYERLQAYLIRKLAPEETPAATKNDILLSWPGEKTDLVELGYALYCWLRARKSKVTTQQVMTWLEASFGLKLSRSHQRLAEIKLRKLLSRTRFLDELREALNGYMDEGDAWEPNGK